MKKILCMTSTIFLINLILIPDGQAIARTFSIELYCIGDDDKCRCVSFPDDEPPYSMSVDAIFSCDTALFCIRGNFYIEGGFGGGSYVRFGILFSAGWSGKTQSYSFNGVWIDGIMLGYGDADLFIDDCVFSFFFVGKETTFENW